MPTVFYSIIHKKQLKYPYSGMGLLCPSGNTRDFMYRVHTYEINWFSTYGSSRRCIYMPSRSLGNLHAHTWQPSRHIHPFMFFLTQFLIQPSSMNIDRDSVIQNIWNITQYCILLYILRSGCLTLLMFLVVFPFLLSSKSSLHRGIDSPINHSRSYGFIHYKTTDLIMISAISSFLQSKY